MHDPRHATPQRVAPDPPEFEAVPVRRYVCEHRHEHAGLRHWVDVARMAPGELERIDHLAQRHRDLVQHPSTQVLEAEVPLGRGEVDDAKHGAVPLP
jgi:hypothetical protein